MDDNYLDIPPEEIDPLELIKDVKQWNAYREKYEDWKPNLEGADLTNVNLQEANLDNANLQEADLGWANLKKASLAFADVRGANLDTANLQEANLHLTNLPEAILMGVNLQQANIFASDLKKANLRGANFRNSVILFSDLRGADLRNATYVRFDQTLIEGALLSPNSNEPWTVLRREYTGSKLLFHLLLLILFLIPLASKTFFWNVVSEGQGIWDSPAINEMDKRFVLSLVVGMPGSRETWLSTQTFWFVTNLLIIAYNAARMLLTVNIGHMREELESTGSSPKYHQDFPKFKEISGIGSAYAFVKSAFLFVTKSESIDWLMWIHKKAQWLLIIGASLAVVNIIRWLFTTVYAPV